MQLLIWQKIIISEQSVNPTEKELKYLQAITTPTKLQTMEMGEYH